MAQTSFNISDLFQSVFGYRPHLRFDPINARKTVSATGAEYYATDHFGREYFMPVTLSYTPQGTPANNLSKPKEFNLPYPVIGIKGEKNIVQTTLAGRRGTVKEMINLKDYEISITGFVIDTANDFPEDDVAQMRELYEQNTAIRIKCALTDIFLLRNDRNSSDKVVIKSLEFKAAVGIKNLRAYILTLVSDEDFNLEEIE